MEKRKRPRWTAAEERVLVDQVTRHANNLRDGFRAAARILDNRSWVSCEYHWYTKLSKAKSPVCFATIGYKTKNINRKVVTDKSSDNTETTTVKWWNKLLKFLKLSK